MAINLGAEARKLFQPIDVGRAAVVGDDGEIVDWASLKTYRYLRLGMVIVVVALAAAIVLEHRKAGCFQESISAYYFTPARSVFVGALIAIGVSLIVIKGSTAFEDGCLNVAGMLAPIVAFVPTTDVGVCWSEDPGRSPLNPDGTLAPWVKANVDNNVGALLIAGAVALVAAVVIATIAAKVDRKPVLDSARRLDAGTVIGLVATLVLILVGTALLWWWDGFATGSHGIAAGVMFGFLALAAVGNGVQGLRATPRSSWGGWYLAVGVVMAVVAVALQLPRDWDHRILVLEIVEVALFVAFWVIQSFERWRRTV